MRRHGTGNRGESLLPLGRRPLGQGRGWAGTGSVDIGEGRVRSDVTVGEELGT